MYTLARLFNGRRSRSFHLFLTSPIFGTETLFDSKCAAMLTYRGYFNKTKGPFTLLYIRDKNHAIFVHMIVWPVLIQA